MFYRKMFCFEGDLLAAGIPQSLSNGKACGLVFVSDSLA
jgi:hypothetical protein